MQWVPNSDSGLQQTAFIFFVVGLLFEGGGKAVFWGRGNIKGEERFILEQINTVLGTL